jgi:hypothetical protein
MYRDNGYEAIFLELANRQNEFLERIAVALETIAAKEPPSTDRTDLPKPAPRPTHW